MQDVLPLEVSPGENKKNSIQKLVIAGLSFLCWVSPMLGLGVFFPKTVWRGGILGCFMMFGALCFHLTLAKIDVGDGGKMFGSAVLVLLCCFAIIVFHEQDLEHLGE